MSIARAHFQRVTAEREAAAGKAVAITSGGGGTLAERMAALLALHRATLKTFQSVSRKIEAKRGFLPEYGPYVDGVLAADAGGADDVLTTIMLWRLDVGDWDGALTIAAHGIRHGLPMPEGLKRDLPTTLVEEIADATAQAGEKTAAALVAALNQALELTAECDMPDEVRAKAHKALGLLLSDTAPDSAIEHLEAALSLHPGCGVKTQLARLRKSQDGA